MSERSAKLLSWMFRIDFPDESRMLFSELSEIAFVFLEYLLSPTAAFTSSSATTDCFGVE